MQLCVGLALHSDIDKAGNADIEIEPGQIARAVIAAFSSESELVDLAIALLHEDAARIDLGRLQGERALRGAILEAEIGGRERLGLTSGAGGSGAGLGAKRPPMRKLLVMIVRSGAKPGCRC